MNIELLLKLNVLFYTLFFVVFIVLITTGQRVSDQIEKRKMALEKIKAEKAQLTKRSDFIA